MKKQTKYLIIIVVAFFILIILSDALFVVSEMNQVIITQFGDPIRGTITKAGLHIKMPFIQKANYFEKRWLEWDGDVNQIPTKDKKYIWVDTYARWRIQEPLTFFQRVFDERGAQSRLAEELEFILDKEEIRKITTGREKIAEMILNKSSEITKEVGIELRDVRIKRINYVDEVQQKVFDRMIAERQRIASKYRSEGDGRAAEISGQKERELKKIQSEAYRKAQEIKGKADAEATKIYAQAYNRDPEFYQFMKTLETYRKIMDQKTWLILSTEAEFLKYLKKTSK